MTILQKIILIMGLLSFFGCKGQESGNTKNFKNLNDDLKNKYRVELNRDSDKDFDKEFIRTTDLEFSLINSYGFDAIKLIFEKRNSEHYYLLGNFPEDCPWFNMNGLSKQKFVDSNFKPISSQIPALLKSIKERCLFIYSEQLDSTWHLHYMLKMKLYDDRDYYRVYTGGEPILNPDLNDNLKKFDWFLPKDLKRFYAIHNGFGEIYDANFILNNNDIRVMGEMMNPICEEQNSFPEDYKFDNLLEFFPDGTGNAQCFYRYNSGNNITVDWDHETWEISHQMGFFDFINQRMSEIDEE
jgi:hypothetical protein